MLRKKWLISNNTWRRLLWQCFECRPALSVSGSADFYGSRYSTKVSSRRPLLMNYIFHPAEYYFFLGVGLSKDKVNAVHCCLKHTLLFSNFTIVPGEIKRALSTCRCVQWAFMSYLITGKLFFDWAEVWAEFGQTMGLDDFHRNTMSRQQRCCLKSFSRCWAPTHYCGQQACELQ